MALFMSISEGVPEIKLAKVKMKMEQENMPEIIIGSDDFPPFNKCSKNSPTSSGRPLKKSFLRIN